jgi:hypothetical protein
MGHVPVKAVVDFDALNDKVILRSLVEGLGHEYTEELEKDRKVVDAHIRGSEPILQVDDIRQGIASVLHENSGRRVTSQLIRKIREYLEPETGWRAAKRVGQSSVPSGDASVALARLLSNLKERGLFVVPYGEVESFVKSVGGKGPRWVTEVIEKDHIASATEAHHFVDEIIGALL